MTKKTLNLFCLVFLSLLTSCSGVKTAKNASFEAKYSFINRNGYVPPMEESWDIKSDGRRYWIHKTGNPGWGDFGLVMMYDGKNIYEQSQYTPKNSNLKIDIDKQRFWDTSREKKEDLGAGEFIAGRSTTKYKITRGSKADIVWLDSETGVMLQKAYLRNPNNQNLDEALELLTCQSISYVRVSEDQFTPDKIDALMSSMGL